MHDEDALLDDDSDWDSGWDGRPNVFTPPISPTMSNVAGRARALSYRDRLLQALRREHGRPRYDLAIS